MMQLEQCWDLIASEYGVGSELVEAMWDLTQRRGKVFISKSLIIAKTEKIHEKLLIIDS